MSLKKVLGFLILLSVASLPFYGMYKENGIEFVLMAIGFMIVIAVLLFIGIKLFID